MPAFAGMTAPSARMALGLADPGSGAVLGSGVCWHAASVAAIAAARTWFTGQPMLGYFRPLMGWLQQQNRGRKCGWQA